MEKLDNPSFGMLLRLYREQAVDKRARTRLSQELFAVRLSERTGLIVTRNKVSNWENDKTRIAADDRKLLLDILAVLRENEGIASLDESNLLLEAGNYRSLNPNEVQQLFPFKNLDALPNNIPAQEPDQQETVLPPPETPLLQIWNKWQIILATSKAGPQPSWPRVLVALARAALQNWTIFHTLRALGWIWLWFFTWWLIMPSLRWPFENRENAIVSIAMYMVGTIFLPPCISFLINPGNSEFWREQKNIRSWVLRLYAYQGAGIGFHLGYFAAFLITLVSYQLPLRTSLWFELPLALLPLTLGYISAQLVPHNLWRAYHRLDLADGAVFFIFLILGPIWGYFFFYFYSLFLIPNVGLVLILLAVTTLVALMAWRQQRTGSTIIPSYWWTLIYGSILVLYEISIEKNWFQITALATLILLLSVLVARRRIHFTVVGMLAVIVGLGLLFITLGLNIWIGRLLAALLIFTWWRWGKHLLSLPPSFWTVMLIDGTVAWAMREEFLSEVPASAIIVIGTLLALLWERRRWPLMGRSTLE